MAQLPGSKGTFWPLRILLNFLELSWPVRVD